jgi:hypothetical protein
MVRPDTKGVDIIIISKYLVVSSHKFHGFLKLLNIICNSASLSELTEVFDVVAY